MNWFQQRPGALSIMQEDKKKPHTAEIWDGGGRRESRQDAQLSH